MTFKVKVLKPFNVHEGKIVCFETIVLNKDGMPISEMEMPKSDGSIERNELESVLESGKGEVYIELRSSNELIKGLFSSTELWKFWKGHYKNFINDIATFEVKSSYRSK